MPDPATAASWVVLALGSGVAAGLANNLLGFIRDHLGYRAKKAADQKATEAALQQQSNEQAHQIKMDELRRTSEADLRRDQAFESAREELIDAAAKVHDYLESDWYQRFGAEYDFHLRPTSLTPTKREDVYIGLQRIQHRHPRHEVRVAAARLSSRIRSAYDVPRQDGQPVIEDDPEELGELMDLSQELTEGLHNPDYQFSEKLSRP